MTFGEKIRSCRWNVRVEHSSSFARSRWVSKQFCPHLIESDRSGWRRAEKGLCKVMNRASQGNIYERKSRRKGDQEDCSSEEEEGSIPTRDTDDSSSTSTERERELPEGQCVDCFTRQFLPTLCMKTRMKRHQIPVTWRLPFSSLSSVFENALQDGASAGMPQRRHC